MLKPITLKNGLTVLRIPKPGLKTTLVVFVSTSGSVIEEGYFPPGITHLVERLFWCGTDKHPSTRSLNLILENIGGNFSSLTSHEMMVLYLTVPHYNQFKAVSMLSEVVQRSYFDARDIEREKKLIIEKIKEKNENLELDPMYLSMSNIYQNTNLGQPVAGFVDSVNSITQEHILEFIAHQLRPDKCCLIIAGNFENKSLLELVEQEWGVWNPKTKKYLQQLDFHREDLGNLPRLLYRQKGISQTSLTINFVLNEGLRPKAILDNERSDKPVEIDYAKVLKNYLKDQSLLLVLNSLLGQGMSSRLWIKTVEEEMLFTQIQSEVYKFQQTGFLQIFGRIENSLFSFGLESVLSVLEAFKKTTVSINELVKAKEYLKGRMILEQEDLTTSIFWQIEQLIGTGLNFEMEDLFEHIQNVDAASIRALAGELFTSERLVITSIGPAKETRLVEKLIKKYLG